MRSRFVWMVGIAEVMICVAISSSLPVTQEESPQPATLNCPDSHHGCAKPIATLSCLEVILNEVANAAAALNRF